MFVTRRSSMFSTVGLNPTIDLQFCAICFDPTNAPNMFREVILCFASKSLTDVCDLSNSPSQLQSFALYDKYFAPTIPRQDVNITKLLTCAQLGHVHFQSRLPLFFS